DEVPARPLNMVAIEATNRGAADMAWAMLTSAPPVAEVDPETVASRAAGGLGLDVREPAEYAHGHVPGSVNLPQAALASRLEELPRDRPIWVICQVGGRSRRAAQFLKQVGFEQAASVGGGIVAWRAAGQPVDVGDAAGTGPRIVESEWAHAGASSDHPI